MGHSQERAQGSKPLQQQSPLSSLPANPHLFDVRACHADDEKNKRELVGPVGRLSKEKFHRNAINVGAKKLKLHLRSYYLAIQSLSREFH